VTSPDPSRLLGETKLERRLDAAVARATTPRGAAVVIALASIVVTIGAGFLMTVAEHERYPSIGSGLWWAIQTTTTVGYGDNVPENVPGRLVAAFVMLFGIGFLTVITAAITSTFVARSRSAAGSGAATPEQLLQLDEQLRQLDQRLERIEAALTRPG
jgi:voltage-gated potassium channel